MNRLRVAAFVLLLGPAASISDAAADGGFSIGPRRAWFVTAGGTGGGTVATDSRGGFVGGELSLVRVVDRRFAGVYADAYYDFGVGGTYLTAGPELGRIRRSATMPLALGVDAGGVVRLDGETSVGATGRVFVTVAGSFSVFGRYAFLDAADDDHVIQVGVTLKFPVAPPF
jgi:hypothetical protein